MDFELASYDWNGTLYNDCHATYSATAHVFKTIAPEIPRPTLDEYRNKPAPSMILEFYYQHGIPKAVTSKEIGAIWWPHYHQECERVTLNNGAYSLLWLGKEKQIFNCIVSSAPNDASHYLERLGIASLFQKTRFEARPKGDALLEVLEHFKVKPKRAFHVDDTADGIAEAKKVGVVAIGFTGGQNSEALIRAAKPDYIVHHFAEIRPLLSD